MKLKITLGLVVLAVACAAVFASGDVSKEEKTVTTSIQRYQIISGSGQIALYRLDTQTGEVLALRLFSGTPDMTKMQQEWINVTPR